MKTGDKAAMVDGPMIGTVVAVAPSTHFYFPDGTPEGLPNLLYTLVDVELPNGKVVTVGFYEEPRG